MLDIEISQASAVIAPATRFLLAWWMLCWLYTCFALHKILCIVYFFWHCILLHFYFYLFLVLSPLPYLHYHLLYIINYLPFSTTSWHGVRYSIKLFYVIITLPIYLTIPLHWIIPSLHNRENSSYCHHLSSRCLVSHSQSCFEIVASTCRLVLPVQRAQGDGRS